MLTKVSSFFLSSCISCHFFYLSFFTQNLSLSLSLSLVTKRRPWTKPAKLILDTPSTVDLSNFTLTLPRGMDAAVRRQIAAMPSTAGAFL